MAIYYNKEAVEGYGDGIIETDEPPHVTPYRSIGGGAARGGNILFTIDGRVYNVHPYRNDLGGYPVRFSDSLDQIHYLARLLGDTE